MKEQSHLEHVRRENERGEVAFGAIVWFLAGFTLGSCLVLLLMKVPEFSAYSDHYTLGASLTVEPAHYRSSYAMACVCSNQPATRGNNRLPLPDRDLTWGQSIDDGLTGSAEVVDVRFDSGSVTDEF
jgi:hypothetical protein